MIFPLDFSSPVLWLLVVLTLVDVALLFIYIIKKNEAALNACLIIFIIFIGIVAYFAPVPWFFVILVLANIAYIIYLITKNKVALRVCLIMLPMLGGISILIVTQSPKQETLSIVQYNCEQSGGVFGNSGCVCPIEKGLGQAQEMMYDQNTGYCKTTAGSPGGSIGLTGQGQEIYLIKSERDACLKELATYKNK